MVTACIDQSHRKRRSPRTEQEWGEPVTVYDLIVERWNGLSATERQRRAAECLTKGHDWAPLSWGPNVCTRCLKYDGAG